ncbi:hypothetical protein HPP92_011352 [Vanilla planifolia]|uniref:Uncharacterized protein n=1 Tax=Vanilla planifolia TaxID=51239 RepID=A0A835UYM8_VANPL|nr:hypothetical protein HPP92_011647 [Vanilla planifolia]KAG0483268.1 hypothetical protein HPP92_011352 [Vanilla planifolia]
MAASLGFAFKLFIMVLAITSIFNPGVKVAGDVCRAHCSPEVNLCDEICINNGFLLGGKCKLLNPTDKFPTCCCIT